MSIKHRFQKSKDIINTGYGSVGSGRLLLADGTPNVKKTGVPFWNSISLYHSFLRLSRLKFVGLIFLIYTVINLFFATLFYFIGTEHLTGIEAKTKTDQFFEAFFFSSQSLTTVGYGRVAPIGWAANTIASIESLIGILIFAVVTGLIYGRFSRPKAYIKFSNNILIAPFKEETALMLRLATTKNNHLTDVNAEMTLSILENIAGAMVNKFYTLPLEISKISSLALTWTLVHKIDENSPLFALTNSDFEFCKPEIFVSIRAFDDHFSNTVQQRTSYVNTQIVYGAKFLPAFVTNPDAAYQILDIGKLNSFELVNLS